MTYDQHRNVSGIKKNEDCQQSVAPSIGTYTKMHIARLTHHSNHKRIHFGILAFIHFPFNELVTSC